MKTAEVNMVVAQTIIININSYIHALTLANGDPNNQYKVIVDSSFLNHTFLHDE